MLFGVCGGAARRFGVDAYVVRLALLLLTLTGGLGVVAVRRGLGAEPAAGRHCRHRTPLDQRLVSTRSVATAAAAGGLLMTARNVGLWPGDTIMIPAVVVASGSALLWYRGRDPHADGRSARACAAGQGHALAIAGWRRAGTRRSGRVGGTRRAPRAASRCARCFGDGVGRSRRVGRPVPRPSDDAATRRRTCRASAIRSATTWLRTCTTPCCKHSH